MIISILSYPNIHWILSIAPGGGRSGVTTGDDATKYNLFFTPLLSCLADCVVSWSDYSFISRMRYEYLVLIRSCLSLINTGGNL